MSPAGKVRPARPDTGLTPDGRRLRVTTSYTRRGSRFSARQQEAYDAHAAHWVVPQSAVDQPEIDVASWFGRAAPLVVEIGCGRGDATGPLAARHPEWNVLGLEVWEPGVAETLSHVARARARNVRLLAVDAVWLFEHVLAPAAVTEVWTFFPDPWHKARHHKRRLVSADFARTVASRLAPGGVWRIATDWADYAEHIESELAGVPEVHYSRVPRWEERPLTRFEKRGLREGREIVDFRVERSG